MKTNAVVLTLFALLFFAGQASAVSNAGATAVQYFNLTSAVSTSVNSQLFQVLFSNATTTGRPFTFLNASLANATINILPVLIYANGTEQPLNNSISACSYFETPFVVNGSFMGTSLWVSVPVLASGTNASQLAIESGSAISNTAYNESCVFTNTNFTILHEKAGGAIAMGFNSNWNGANASGTANGAAKNQTAGAQGYSTLGSTAAYIGSPYSSASNLSSFGVWSRFFVETAFANTQTMFHDTAGFWYVATSGGNFKVEWSDGVLKSITTPFSNFAAGTYHSVGAFINVSNGGGMNLMIDGTTNGSAASTAVGGGGLLKEGIATGGIANTPVTYLSTILLVGAPNTFMTGLWGNNIYDTMTQYSSTTYVTTPARYTASYTNPAYELTNQTYQLFVNASAWPTATNVTAFMTWNSTNYTATTVTNTSDLNYTFTFHIVPGVLQVNNSQVALNFTFRTGFSNGTQGPNQTTTSETQSFYFGQYFTGFTISPTAQSEGNPVYLNSSIANFTGGLSGYGLAVTGTWNGTTATSTTNSSNYTNGFTAPTLGNATVNLTGYMTLNLSYLGAWRSVTSGLNWSVIYLINVTNCSSSTDYIANFTFVNEETLTNMNGTLNIAVELTNAAGTLTRESNFSFVNVTTAAICVSPAGSYYLTTNQDYYSDYANQSFNQRHYYYRNASVTTTSPTATNLYLLSSSIGDIVQISLVDSAGLSQEDFIIQATRYYPSLASYLLVDMGITGQDGLTNLFLRPIDTQHRFFAYTNETLIQAFTPQLISSCSGGVCTLTLTLTGSSLESYLSKGIYVAFTCGNSTLAGDTWFTCTYSDPSSSLSLAHLRVNWIGLYVNVSACDTTSTSAAGAVACNLGNTSTKSYYWTFGVGFSPEQTLAAGSVEAPQTDSFGSIGIVVMIVTVVGIGFMGWRSPEEGIISVAAAILIGQLSGFLYLSTAGLIGVLIVAAILAYKGR